MAGGGRLARASAMAVALCALTAAPALAVPTCADGPDGVRSVLAGKGSLESVIVDEAGRLFYSDTTLGAFLRMDSPDSTPRVLASVPQPGGLTFEPGGALIAGEGNALVNGVAAIVTPRARLLRIDPDTGATSVYATGVSMGNGLATGPDGEVYASDDGGLYIDRIPPGGGVADTKWARVTSANGLAVSPDGASLYAAQTFQPAKVQRVEIADPENVQTHADPGPLDMAAGPDGMDIDADGRLYVAANGAGEVWRVETDGAICALLRGLRFPSAVALGKGRTGFAAGNLYVVTFAGDLIELSGATL